MTLYSLINELHAKKIKLWAQDGELKFKAAKGALTSDIREQLIRNKSELLAFLQQVASARKIPPIRPVDRTAMDCLPLSFSQERLWFISQLDTNNTSYSVPLAARIRGELDLDHVDQALNLIIARHENLRTIFPGVEGKAQQIILDHLDFKVERIDLSDHADEAERDQRARAICLHEAGIPFDLARGPLMRGKVIRLAPQEHVIMLNMHHIISDGWSMGVLLKELGTTIDALRQGRTPEFAPLPIQYVDYSVWQRNWLENGNVLKQQLAYWKEKLAGVPESLNLATDYPRPAVQSFAGAMYRFTIDAPLTDKLRKLAESQGATLYMVLLAAYKVLLHRYTGQEDICVGSAIANRQYGETEALIGMLVNTLAMRTQLKGEDTFNDVLTRVKSTCLEAYENQDAPFDKVVDAVLPQRNIAINPIYQTLIVLQNAPLDLGKQIELYSLEGKTSNLDQVIELTESPEGLKGLFEYSTALYKPQTIERVVDHLIALCRAITARPDAMLKELEYLGEAEKQRLLVKDAPKDYPSNKCIHELFAEQVAQGPDRIAVSCENEQLTYRELYDRSHELALHLQSLGVGPDHLVGICVEKSLDMVVGIMGILQAGGAYVPLDPDYPDSRLEHMLQDSKASIVLTQETLKAKLNPLVTGETRLLALDTQWSQIRESAAALTAAGGRLQRQVQSHHLAYVIYTSGSTGKPKGVMIEHRNFHRLFTTAQPWYHFSGDDVIPVLHSYSFDVSVFEMFCGLSSGARVVVVPDAIRKSDKVVDFLIENGVTVLNQTPSAFYALAELVNEKNASALQRKLRLVIFAGEALNFRKLARWVRYMGLTRAKLVNMYGITETTVHVTYCPVESIDTDSSNIGVPLADLDAYVLDRYNHLLPVGVPGELHVAGGGLARGYLNRPELTEQRFVSNPFVAGTRMYKSGDLARWLDDGTLEYLGRIDTQVKIRGYRIETGEIESRLNSFPGIRNSVVVAQGQEAGKRLIAFYLVDDTDNFVAEKEALRAHLRRYLPDYMLPADFMKLESIPLTSNGKVDRRALERMEVGTQAGARHVGPRNDTERQLVDLWSEVLNLAPGVLGVHDNFFERGGNSLLAVRLMAKVNSHFGQNLHLAALFTAPYVAGLAQLISAGEGKAPDIVVPMQTQGSQRPIFAMPGADGNALSLQRLCLALGAEQPFYGLQAVGLDGKTLPLDSIESTARANITALRSIQAAGPYRLLGYSYGGVVAFEVARLLLEQGEEVESLMLLDTAVPDIMQKKLAANEITMLVEGCKSVARFKYRVELKVDAEHLQRMPAHGRYEYIAGQFTHEHGIKTTAEDIASTFRLVQSAEQCLRTYKPPGLSKEIEVFLFRATDREPGYADDYGWNEFLQSPLKVIDIEANHYSMVDLDRAVQQLAAGVTSTR